MTKNLENKTQGEPTSVAGTVNDSQYQPKKSGYLGKTVKAVALAGAIVCAGFAVRVGYEGYKFAKGMGELNNTPLFHLSNEGMGIK